MQVAKPEGPRQGEVLGEEQRAPSQSPPSRGLGGVSSPSGVWGEASAKIDLGIRFQLLRIHLLELQADLRGTGDMPSKLAKR